MDNMKLDEKQYYIVSLDNGIRREEPVSIEIFNNFNDGSKLVQLNKTVFGVLKENSQNPDTMFIDDYDIIKADIAELLDIDHEETKRIVTDDSEYGVFTLLNYSKDMETRISATTILNHMVEYINNGLIEVEESQWISETLTLPETTKGNAIKDHDTIEKLIKLGMTSIITTISKQSGLPISEKKEKAIRKYYTRMILFDYLVGRKYRGLDYYLVTPVTEEGNPIWAEARFSPISVSNSPMKDELVGDNEYLLNNKLIDREELLKVLFERFYYELKKTTESLNEASRLYIDAINRIIYNNTSLEKSIQLEDEIEKNLSRINKEQKAKEKVLEKDQRINKVERTMATQSLNVRVTTKLDLIQKKYPINPKEHPELLEDNKKDKKEDIKLIVEKNNSSNKGFAGTAILVSTIALICGIATGVAYILITFGN